MNEVTTYSPQPMPSVQIDTGAVQLPNPVEVSLPGKPGKQPKPIDKSLKDADRRLKGDAKSKSGHDPDLDGNDGDNAETAKQRRDAKDGTRRKELDSALKAADAKLKGNAVSVSDTPEHRHLDAPARFSPEARAEWSKAPPAVQHEVHRMHRELEGGIRQYRAAAHAYSEVADYDQHCRKHGTTIRRALDQYTGLDRALRSPNLESRLPAIEAVLAHAGITPQRYAQLILSQTPEDRARIATTAMASRLQQVETALQQQNQQSQFEREYAATMISMTQNVTAFAATRPDFDELADDIAREINAGHDLEAAYANAKRRKVNPAGSKSIAGAPNSGADMPAKKKGRVSIDDALANAHRRLAS